MDTQQHNHLSYEKLQYFLKNKHRLNHEELTVYKTDIDNCKKCWATWNKVRWDVAIDSQGVQELREYLGDQFQEYFDSSWALAKDWYKSSPKTPSEIEDFYRNTPHYAYNSLIFYESGDREDLSGVIKNLSERYDPKSVLDYGCGIGTDGLVMLEHDIKVNFVDYNHPGLDFLRWRLKRRGYEEGKHYQVIELDQNVIFPSVDLVWCVDVLEHMVDPFQILNVLSKKTKLFTFFTDADDKAGGRHPFHFSFDLQLLLSKLKKMGFVCKKEGLFQVCSR